MKIEDPILVEMTKQGLAALVEDEERYFCAVQIREAWPLPDGELSDDVNEALQAFVASGVSGWATKNRAVSEEEVSRSVTESISRHLEETRGEESATPFLLKVQQELVDAGIIADPAERKKKSA